MASNDHISDPVALEIYQGHLDNATRALFTGDFEAFITHLKYPHFIRTSTSNFIIRDVVQHRRLFDALYEGVKAEGLTDLVRIAESAVFVSETELIGTHVSHRMRNGYRVTPPYQNRMRLVLDADGCWRETHSSTAIDNKAGKFGILRGSEDPNKIPTLFGDPEGKPT